MTMTDGEIEKRFQKILNANDIKKLESISIFELAKNSYVVFGKYFVTKKSKSNVEVAYHNKEVIYSFSSMKNAICWCIFDMRGKFLDANRIISLDRNIVNEQVQIEIHKKMFSKAKTLEEKLIFLAKLNEEKIKRSQMLNQLSDYIIQSDYWQQLKYRLKTEH